MDSKIEKEPHRSSSERAEEAVKTTLPGVVGVALDLDTQTGLKSPHMKRVKPSRPIEIPHDPLAINEEETYDSEEDASSSGFDSPESLILDLFHAEGAGEYSDGVTLVNKSNIDDIKMSPEEAEALKAELRLVGSANFMRKYIHGASRYTIKELLYAFGYSLPDDFEFPPETILGLLRMAVESELRRRKKLEHLNTIDDIVNLIRTSNNIIVLAGAGISTSCGIPDFRSDKGIYTMLSDWGLDDPQDMFDIEVFRDNPQIFYSFAKEVLPSTSKFSPTHAFLKLLQDKNKVLRVYTQNIDNLERLAGISDDKLVQCHGSFATASCMRCQLQVPGDEIREEILKGVIPKCKACEAEREEQEKRRKSNGKKRKRASDWENDDDDEEDDIIEGVMKPDITFFGEMLSKKFDHTLLGPPGNPDLGDVRKCDLLICIGTSLKVAPVSEIIGVLPASIPQVYISKTPVMHTEFDVMLLGSCDDIIRDLVRRCGYHLEHEKLEGGTSDYGESAEWKNHRRGVYEIIDESMDTYTGEA